ncbi:MAG: PilN domain-containing protein [Phycisphaeraceae bacterium]
MAKNMSFLPDDYLERRIAQRTNAICLALFVVVSFGIVGAYFVSTRQGSEIRALDAEVSDRYEEAARRLDQLEALQSQKQEMLRKAELTAVLIERVPRTLLLAEMINHMPEAVSLRQMTLESHQLAATVRSRTAMQRERQRLGQTGETEDAFQIPETELTLSIVGIAPTDVEVAQLMTALGQHRLFNDVSLQFSEQTEVDRRAMRQFQIDMTIEQGLDLQSVEPTMVRRGGSNPMDERIEFDGDAWREPQTPIAPAGGRD